MSQGVGAVLIADVIIGTFMKSQGTRTLLRSCVGGMNKTPTLPRDIADAPIGGPYDILANFTNPLLNATNAIPIARIETIETVMTDETHLVSI